MIFENFIKDKVTSESIKNLYINIFDGIKYLEEKYNKDVKQFEKREINELINLYGKGKTYNATMVKIGLIKKFFNYIGNNSINTVIDKIDNLVSDSYELQHSRYISKEDLKGIIGKLDNASDRCILMLLRNGIGIKYEIEDLINLTIDDINFDDKTIYSKPIDDYTMELVKQTVDEKEYISVGAYEKIIVYNPNSKYLFKTRTTKRTDNGLLPFKTSGFRGRLQRIRIALDDDERVILSNLILSYVVDLVIDYEVKNDKYLTQNELRMFLNKTIGNSKNTYDIRCMSTYIKNVIK